MIDKKKGYMNETKARNRHLREQIDKHRKERTIFDGIFTKLEKDILQKENKLLKLISDEEAESQELDKNKDNYEKMLTHSQKEQVHFEENYSQIILGINDKPDFDENNLSENEADHMEVQQEILAQSEFNESTARYGEKKGR